MIRATDNTRWHSFYANSITRQIHLLISLIKKNKKAPDTLINHFDSMLAVFEEGISHPDPATRLALIDFVRTLHPLPLWWGKWSEWMRVIEKATAIAQEADKINSLVWLHLTQSEMLISGSDAKKALSLAKKAFHLARTYRNPEMIFRAEMKIFEAEKDIGYIGDRINAIAMLEETLSTKKNLLPEKVFQTLEVEFLLKKTDVLRRLGRKNDAALTIQKAHNLAIKNLDEDNLLIAQVYNRRGATYWTAEKSDLAIADFEKATEIFTSWGDQASQVYSTGYIGLVHWSAGRYKEAEKILQSSISMAEGIKALQWQTIQTGNLGLVKFLRGRLPQALPLMEQHHTLSQLINNRAEAERANANIGYAQTYLGNFQDAYQRLSQYLAYTKEMQFHIGTGVACANMAWVMDGLGDINSALDYAEKSSYMAKKTDAPLLKIVAIRSLSELQKDQTSKVRYAEKAYILAKKQSRRFNEAGALLALADCHKNEFLRNEAIQLLEELGSTDWLKVPLVFKTLRLPLLYWG